MPSFKEKLSTPALIHSNNASANNIIFINKTLSDLDTIKNSVNSSTQFIVYEPMNTQ